MAVADADVKERAMAVALSDVARSSDGTCGDGSDCDDTGKAAQ